MRFCNFIFSPFSLPGGLLCILALYYSMQTYAHFKFCFQCMHADVFRI